MHDESAATERTAELLAALTDIGKVPHLADEVDYRGLAWHAICGLEDDLLDFQRKNRWCGSTDGWYIVIGKALLCAGAPVQVSIPSVPQYVGWGDVQAWLQHDNAAVVVEPGYGVHVFDLPTFEASYSGDIIAGAAFADDSAIALNAAFRWRSDDEAALYELLSGDT